MILYVNSCLFCTLPILERTNHSPSGRNVTWAHQNRFLFSVSAGNEIKTSVPPSIFLADSAGGQLRNHGLKDIWLPNFCVYLNDMNVKRDSQGCFGSLLNLFLFPPPPPVPSLCFLGPWLLFSQLKISCSNLENMLKKENAKPFWSQKKDKVYGRYFKTVQGF